MQFNISAFLLLAAGLSAALPLPAGSEIHTHTKREPATLTQVVHKKVIVYVNGNGQQISATTIVDNPTSVQTDTAQAVNVNNRIAQNNPNPVVNTAQTQPTGTVPPPAESSVTTPSPGNSGPGEAVRAGAPFTSGVTYSAILPGQQCKSPDQIQSDIKFLIGKGHDLIRLYGSECEAISNLKAAVKGTNTWMFLGIYDINNVAAEAATIHTQLGKEWDQVHTVAIGNEVVQSNRASPAAVVTAVNSGRQTLRGLGYQGPVVTVDTAVMVEQHPELCTSGDYCAANCHVFWDQAGPGNAATAIEGHVKTLKEKTGMSNIVIAESGWPTCGSANVAAVPGSSQQATAIASLKSVSSARVILFSAFNELWKPDNDGTFGTEKCWGVYGNGPSGQ